MMESLPNILNISVYVSRSQVFTCHFYWLPGAKKPNMSLSEGRLQRESRGGRRKNGELLIE